MRNGEGMEREELGGVGEIEKGRETKTEGGGERA